ncbi:S41 family peptidase [Paenibacillus sp. ACRRX]|uniref:S41 family peptidase n=1 Tax=unclassified Paenibacillus TaxID=185978 RepID=UPI001EF498FF|nr:MULTISPECIES: S41 family peptidase [unclassified Paenibacillus]MCG7407961.1 S41 family peptidase [Paenibacillus sp. ACRRX]MDK8181658.1 S41 family peptidase [Paenibacillus sp. UMB4589-SE434]
MNFKGRTVAVMVGTAIVVSSLLTMTAKDLPIFASSGQASAGSGGLSTKEVQKLSSVLQVIESKYFKEVDRNKLVNGAVEGMFTALGDPYSTYMQKQEADSFNVSVEGGFTGIGAEVSMEEGNVTIVSPIKDTPAERAGLKPKDVLISVDGTNLTGLTLNQAVEKIRGPRGSTVKIEVKRPGSPDTMTFNIVRDKVDLETVYPSMLEGKVGYIEIRQFSTNTHEHFVKALDDLEAKGMKGLVIDVRNNPGGVLDIVEKMTQPFIQKGKPLLQVEYRNKEREVHKSEGTAKPKTYPIAILTNKGSASASEIMASALQESAGVKIVGEHTFGKGTVQTSYTTSGDEGSLIKITIAKWLTPKGNWIHQKGIEPDVPVKQPDYFNAAPVVKDKTLKLDMNSSDVQNVQVILGGLGYKLDRKDGYFSASTETALKAFQKQHTLTANGQVDKQTAEKLELEIIKAMREPKNDAQLKAAIQTVQKEIR